MNTVIKTSVAMGQVDKLIADMDATGFELDTIREHNTMFGSFWLLFRRSVTVNADVDELELARIGESVQAMRNAEVAPHDPPGVFVK